MHRRGLLGAMAAMLLIPLAALGETWRRPGTNTGGADGRFRWIDGGGRSPAEGAPADSGHVALGTVRGRGTVLQGGNGGPNGGRGQDIVVRGRSLEINVGPGEEVILRGGEVRVIVNPDFEGASGIHSEWPA